MEDGSGASNAGLAAQIRAWMRQFTCLRPTRGELSCREFPVTVQKPKNTGGGNPKSEEDGLAARDGGSRNWYVSDTAVAHVVPGKKSEAQRVHPVACVKAQFRCDPMIRFPPLAAAGGSAGSWSRMMTVGTGDGDDDGARFSRSESHIEDRLVTRAGVAPLAAEDDRARRPPQTDTRGTTGQTESAEGLSASNHMP